MSAKTKPTYELPGGQTECIKDDGVVNDSLGTVNSADSTGIDDNKDTGGAKSENTNTRED